MSQRITKIALIGFCLLLILACQSTERSHTPGDLFDLEIFLNQQSQKADVLQQARMVNSGNSGTDTLYFERYAVDSILRIIHGYQYSRKEQAGEFNRETSNRGPSECLTWEPEIASDVRYMTVCRRQGEVSVIEGRKVSNSILNVLVQSYVWDIQHSFELQSVFVDKVNSDTLTTQSLLTWKAIE